jgi:hypothetical protein
MSIFVLEYVFYQFSYDQHYERSEDIFRVISKGHVGTEDVNAALAPMSLASQLRKYPQIEAVTRIVKVPEKSVSSRYAKSYEPGVVFADSTFFEVFSRPFLMGKSEHCLADSFSVVISRSAASRLFGNRTPVGEFIQINETDSFEVKAVFQDVPDNSHLKYDFVVPFPIMERQLRNYYGESYQEVRKNWMSLTCYLYFKVNQGTEISAFFQKVNKDLKPKIDAESQKFFENKEFNTSLTFHFQPLDHIYLFSDSTFEIGSTANPVYVFIFLGGAFFILLVTAFNFMNLTTARALDRAREAGIRRIFGAYRRNLVAQFILESVLFCFIALFLGLVLVELFLPFFSDLFHLEFFNKTYREQLNFPWIMFITFLVGLFSGLYPASIFSRIRAADLQSGQSQFSSYPGLWLRGLLVFIQVFVAVLVATIAIGMWRQINHVEETDLGFNPENLILIERARYLDSDVDSVMAEMSKVEGVIHSCKLYNNPGDPASMVSFNFSKDSGRMFLLSVYYVDCSIFKTLDAKLKSGSIECGDSGKVLINEQAASLFNSEKVEGGQLRTIAHRSENEKRFEITGVVKNIYWGSLKSPLRPSVYVPVGSNDLPRSILLRTLPGKTSQAFTKMRQIWNKAGTGAPFSGQLLSEKISSFYKEDYRYSSLAAAFAMLVVIIASLGMTGLVSFLLTTRQQNVLLRKITGFPDFHNFRLLFAGYFSFVLSGAGLALPASQFLLNAWSDTFSIRYQADYLCFAFPVLLVISIALGIALSGMKRLFAGMSLHQF